MKKIAILGAGIAGLTLAYLLKKHHASRCQIQVFEAQPHAGGVIHSERLSGYLCEAGPNGFLDNEPTTLELIEMLQLQSRLTPANPQSRARFVVKNKRLVVLPHSPLSFWDFSLLKSWSKLRLFLEPWIPPKSHPQEESIETFGYRRLGREATRWLLDPMVAGIYAGDIKQLSMSASFPKIARWEEEHGSIVRGALAQKKTKKQKTTPQLHTFLEGIQELPRRLATELTEELHYSEKVEHCHLETHGVFLKTTHRQAFYDLVVVALPSYAASVVLGAQFPEIAQTLLQIRYAPIVTVCHGYANASRVSPLQGFGQLNPSQEQLHSLGTLWSSSIFPNQAPNGFFLLRTLFGGTRSPDILHHPEWIATGLQETQKLLKLRLPPVFLQEYRYERAIAQYEVGHLQKLQKLAEWEHQIQKIFLTGSAYRGVSINSCIKDAFEIVQKIQRFVFQNT